MSLKQIPFLTGKTRKTEVADKAQAELGATADADSRTRYNTTHNLLLVEGRAFSL